MMIDTTQTQIVKEEYKQENIDLEYTSDAVIVQTESQEDFEYKLVGVVLHMGTADAGHYLSYININRSEKDEEAPEWLLTDKEKWLEFNDTLVKDYK